jgi:hypothetical protein
VTGKANFNWIDMKIEATTAELRKYAWIMTGGLSVFGAVALWRGKPTLPIYFFSIAGLFLVFGLVMPRALRPVYVAWMTLAQGLSWINTRILLSLFFYLVVSPISLVMKLAGRDVMRRKVNRATTSYWQLRQPPKSKKEGYEHLY